MKLTKKLEKEILMVIEDYWSSYLKGDLQTWASFLPDDYRNIGTTKAEIWNSKKEIVDFTEKVLDQTVGMAETRNKKTQIIPYAPYFMVHELGDLYVKAEESWVYYAQFRLSSLLEKTADGWKILHQHGSYPDSKTEEGEAFAFDEIKAENKKLRDVIKSRTIELEEKNRELEIEAALERIRAKTMAMQKSDELGATSFLLFEELKALGETSNQISIGLFDEKDQVLILYATLNGEQWKEAAKIDLDEPVVMLKIYTGWKQNKKSIQIDLNGDELKAYNHFRNKFSDLKYEEERWVIHCAFFSKGVLSFSTTTPHNKQTMELLERFAQVFDGTYTRFLDLQKAESQAREAQIEAALEKVRSRSLAVNRSDQFNEVVRVVFEKLGELQIPVSSVCIAIFKEGTKDWDVFGTGAGEDGLATVNFKLPYFKTPFMDDLIVARSKGDEGYFSKVYSEEEKNNYYEYTLKNTALKKLPDDIKQLIWESKRYALSVAYTKNSSIMVNEFDGNVLEDHQADIIKRFTRVFEQVYIRFMDLQKAEAQAREAQIEAALEKVRSRSLAMHKAEELGEVITVVVEKLRDLDFSIGDGVALVTYVEGSKDLIEWMENPGFPAAIKFYLPYFEHPVLSDLWTAKEGGADFLATRYSVEENKSFLNHIFENSDFKHTPQELKDYCLNADTYGYSITFQKNTSIFINDYSGLTLSENEIDILQRFARVFEQAYTRFLDLQKAEAQAREAQVEVSLERVRARTMAMQHSDELKEASGVLIQQVLALGIPAFSCGYNIFEKDADECTAWMSTPDGGIKPAINIPLTADPNFIRFAESKKQGEEFYVLEMRGADMQRHYQYLSDTIPVFAETFNAIRASGQSLPHTQIHHLVNFTYGNLMFITLEPCPDAHDIFKRFGKVFEQTYTRFLDLQKAEAQAREAQVEVALERVRAKAMAMHTTEDFRQVNEVLWEQVKKLKVTGFAGAGIALFDQNDHISWWDFSSAGNIGQHEHRLTHYNYKKYKLLGLEIWDTYQKGEPYYVLEYDLARLKRGAKEWASINPIIAADFEKAIASGQLTYQWGACARITNGFLTFDHLKQPDEDAKKILVKMARAFELAYQRFLDLQKAEAQAREAQIEAALERTRTQSMLMQRSDELDRTIQVFHEQLHLLDIDSEFSYLWLPDEEKSTHLFWATWFESQANNKEELKGHSTLKTKTVVYPLDKTEPSIAACYVAWESGETIHANPVPAEGVKEYFDTWQELLRGAEQFKVEHFPKGVYYVDAYMKYGCFGIMIRELLSEDEKNILSRFTKEFERTYTRFLDLQKAEAQAREAHVEAALERVRTQTIAMHNSEDVGKCILKMFGELTSLGGSKIARCGIGILNHDNENMELWTASRDDKGEVNMGTGNLDMTTHPLLQSVRKAWRDKKPINSYLLEGEDLLAYYKTLNDAPGYTFKINIDKLPERDFHHGFIFDQGILYAFSHEALPEELTSIFQRFSSLFGQTYRRYLDLVNAEAQAREAQIQLGLERVRSRAIAMRHSDELSEAAELLYQEFFKLGVESFSCGYLINDDEEMLWKVYMTNPGEPFFKEYWTVPMEGDPLLKNRYESWKRKEEFHFAVIEGEANRKHHEFIAKYAPWKAEMLNSLPPKLVFNSAHFSLGHLLVITPEKLNAGLEEALVRFASVFDLAYRRFIDLQNAEAQAREAQIEAALEKVRSHTMAMQHPDELEKVVTIVVEKLMELGVVLDANGVIICTYFKDSRDVVHWMASPDFTFSGRYLLPYFDHPIFSDAWNSRESGADYFSKSFSVEAKNSFFEHAFQHSDYKNFPDDFKKWVFQNDKHSLSFAWQKNSAILIPSHTGVVPNETDIVILKRFSKVFEQAYIRFLDLQVKEEQAVKILEEKHRLEATLENLKLTQKQLIQSEKMASLGELTAGIAHEIQNPLNFVNNFSEVSNEILDEMLEEIEKGDFEEAKAIAKDIKHNLEKINHHGKRADAIVKGMLQHSRKSTAAKEPADINKLTDEFLRLAYHGLRAKDKSFNAKLITDYDDGIGTVSIIAQDMGRVILNLITNAFYAVNQKKIQQSNGFEPTVIVTTKKADGQVLITVKDNGDGIPSHVLEKIFQPFFTTKPTGQGTGLGLSLAFDIVTKGHGGELNVETTAGKGSTFIITIPNK